MADESTSSADSGRYLPVTRDLRSDIKQILLDLGLRAGDAIPTEATLIEMLGVSRGSLREALKSLQAVGIIETRHGSGMTVGRPSFSSLADGLAFHSQLGEGMDDLSIAADLADIREIVETELVRRLTPTVDSKLLDELDAIVRRMGAASGADELEDLDRTFHMALYDGLGNVLVLQLLDAFWIALHSVRSSLPEPFDEPRDRVRKHSAIVDALRERDPEKAGRAVRDHFALTRTWIESGRQVGPGIPDESSSAR